MNGVAPLAQPRSAVLLAIGASRDLGERIARRAAIPLVDYEEEIFPDGERKIGPAEDGAGRTVLALHSLHARQEDETGGVGDQLLRLLLLIGALKDAGAARVIALTPYLALARQDRRTANGEPVSSRYVAILLQAMGIDAIAALDVHNVSAFENAFSCPSRALSAVPLFVGHFAVQLRGRATDHDDDDAKERPILVLSPDAGGIKRARGFQQRLAGALERPVELGLMDKRRDGDGETFAGSAEGAIAIIIDDMISGGTTLARAAAACRRRGAHQVHAAVTHAVLAPGADKRLGDADLDSLVVSDSIPDAARRCPTLGDRLRVLDCSDRFAGLLLPMEKTPTLGSARR